MKRHFETLTKIFLFLFGLWIGHVLYVHLFQSQLLEQQEQTQDNNNEIRL